MLSIVHVANMLDVYRSVIVLSRGAHSVTIAQVAPRGTMNAFRVTSNNGVSHYVRSFDTLSEAYRSVKREALGA